MQKRGWCCSPTAKPEGEVDKAAPLAGADEPPLMLPVVIVVILRRVGPGHLRGLQ